ADVEQAPAPRTQIVSAPRRSRNFRQSVGTLEALDDLAQPPVLLRVPVRLASVGGFPRNEGPPLGEKGSKPRERFDGYALHLPDGLPEVPNAMHLVDRRANCVGALDRRREHVSRND